MWFSADNFEKEKRESKTIEYNLFSTVCKRKKSNIAATMAPVVHANNITRRCVYPRYREGRYYRI